MKISTKRAMIAASVMVIAAALGGYLSNGKPDAAKQKAYETENHDPPQQTDNSSSIFVDIGSKKVTIPEGYISVAYKDTYADKEQVQAPELIAKIAGDINNAEIAVLSIGSEEIMEMEPIQNIEQYPLALETACKNDFLKIDLLAQNQEDYLVQLYFTVPDDHIGYEGTSDLPALDEDKCHVMCFLKSKDLYDDIKEAWGERITFRALQSPKSITVFYNPEHHLYTEETAAEKIEFTSEDAIEFTKMLQGEANPINDDHSFGITFLIETEENDSICLYYAEDDCAMFQLDGVSYRLESTDDSAVLAQKYIKELEK